MSRELANLPLEEAARAVLAQWAERSSRGEMRASTTDKYCGQLGVFVAYAEMSGVHDTDGITESLCRAWVKAPLSAASPGSRAKAGMPASAATQRGRLVALRQAVEIWANLGCVPDGLLSGYTVKKRPPSDPCPVTPAEAATLRRAGTHSPMDTLLPVIVEFALAGLTQAEIAALHVADVDVDAGTVRVGGSCPRTTDLPGSALPKVRRQLAALERLHETVGADFLPDECPLAQHPAPRYFRSRVRATAIGQHSYRALKLAGITRAGVTPGSMRQFAANACYARTNRVEDVAAELGIVSLDAAYRLIDAQWQADWASTIRAQGA